MKTRLRNFGLAASSALALGTSGCALASKADALSPRYFTPVASAAGSRQVETTAANRELRLGQLGSSAHLEERIAYRLSDTELGYYEDRRWTEPPEEFLRRELFGELFERRGLRRIVAGFAPTLDVELLSFEYVRFGQPRARVKLRYSMRDERGSLRESTIAAEQPLAAGAESDEAQALALAMSQALSEAVRETADQVVTQLAHTPVSATPEKPAPQTPESAAPALETPTPGTSAQQPTARAPKLHQLD